MTYVLTFILPLVGAIMAADQFLSVLAYAGIILVFLAVFVPLAMVYKLRATDTLSESYAAEGGNMMMLFGLAFGGFLLVSQMV
ncbi:tyrosine-specific transport protein [Vibrio ishigakensis]|uniref:Tyrosine-specific transport protein n=1 Tax=Vibrio ishigakensis TaxID=1481914 RepID=A0A0B8PA30_9VIBR|nr:tyrosine-specific transport protein [Vibrio ishigakensis]